MEKFLDELILSERKKRKEKVLDEQIDLERDLPEQYLQTVVMSDKATSIKIPAFMNDLPEKLVEQKYEFEPKPQIIKSTQNGTGTAWRNLSGLQAGMEKNLTGNHFL